VNFNVIFYQIMIHRREISIEISARNAIKRTVKQVVVGSVNTEVTLEVAPGVEITSIMTKASATKLGRTAGKEACAVGKAKDVIWAID
jgi:molybdopterin-binding protein